MKCTHCGKEINEILEKYKIVSLDGDFVHEKCLKDFRQYPLLTDESLLDTLIDE